MEHPASAADNLVPAEQQRTPPPIPWEPLSLQLASTQQVTYSCTLTIPCIGDRSQWTSSKPELRRKTSSKRNGDSPHQNYL